MNQCKLSISHTLRYMQRDDIGQYCVTHIIFVIACIVTLFVKLFASCVRFIYASIHIVMVVIDMRGHVLFCAIDLKYMQSHCVIYIYITPLSKV